jgi:hypothetical protein
MRCLLIFLFLVQVFAITQLSDCMYGIDDPECHAKNDPSYELTVSLDKMNVYLRLKDLFIEKNLFIGVWGSREYSLFLQELIVYLKKNDSGNVNISNLIRALINSGVQSSMVLEEATRSVIKDDNAREVMKTMLRYLDDKESLKPLKI